MSEVIVGQNTYRIDKLDAIKQFHIARRLVPILASFVEVKSRLESSGGGMSSLLPIAEAISKMTDEESEYVLMTCLAVVYKRDSDRWQHLIINGRFVYQDITMQDMVKLTSEVIQENLGDFFSGLQAE